MEIPLGLCPSRAPGPLGLPTGQGLSQHLAPQCFNLVFPFCDAAANSKSFETAHIFLFSKILFKGAISCTSRIQMSVML